MRILVTGADGFVGRYLVRELLDRGHEVIAGLQFDNSALNLPVKGFVFDLLDYHSVHRLIKQANPDGIIHLAAQSMVKLSWESPAATFMINTAGTIHLVNAASDIASEIKILTIGSSEEYGLSGKSGRPLTEESPCLPQNPYASSKLAAGQVALQLAKKAGLRLIHVRPFNHFGPGQREGFVVSDFALQIAKAERGLIAPVIKVGDLSAQRDFTDVRDIVKAYALLIEQEVAPGIYNICSGVPRLIKDILDFLIRQAALPIQIVIDEKRFRPSEVPFFVGSPEKITAAVGWVPQFDFFAGLSATLQWWREVNFGE